MNLIPRRSLLAQPFVFSLILMLHKNSDYVKIWEVYKKEADANKEQDRDVTPIVCWNPWTVGTYLADKDGVLCCATSGISIKLIKTGAWSEPSSLMLLPPFHLLLEKLSEGYIQAFHMNVQSNKHAHCIHETRSWIIWRRIMRNYHSRILIAVKCLYFLFNMNHYNSNGEKVSLLVEKE